MNNAFPVDIRTKKIKSGENKKVFYPQTANMKDTAFQWFMNQSIVDQTQQLMDKQLAEMPTKVAQMLGTYEIKNNQRQVLSLTQSNYTIHEQAANGMTYLKSLTFDLKRRKENQLSDLFKKNSHYVQKLSTLIKKQIKERNMNTIGEFNHIKPNQDFYIADKILVIYFQLFEITPHYVGIPFFPISVYDIQDIIAEDSSLSRMLASS